VSGHRRSLIVGVVLVSTGVALGAALAPFFLVGVFDDAAPDGEPLAPSAADKVVGWTLVGVAGALALAGAVVLATLPTGTVVTGTGERIAGAKGRRGLRLPGGVEWTPAGLVF
jgi:hypothetical protein